MTRARSASGASPRGPAERAAEWKRPLLITVSGLLVFETLTGLWIWLLPFSVSSQAAVLVHTAVGLAFVGPYAVFQLRHWDRYRRAPLSHVVLTGYFAMAASVAATVSGLMLTGQAVFGTRIVQAWDLVHIVATLALVAAALPHFGVLLLRSVRGGLGEALRPWREAQRRFLSGTVGVTVVLGGLVAAVVIAYEPVPFRNEFPEDYSFLYGEDRPFAPSLASTSTGGAFDARSLAGSASCGKGGCHEQIYREWQASAHRYAAMDLGFQKVQSVMAEQNGPESTRYCGGCHDPISLFSGTKNVFVEDLTNLVGYQEGVSCVACHAIKETDVQGNANYTINQPRRYLWELREGPVPEFLSRFLIRAYPRYHVNSLSHRLFKNPEFCAACHKQFIDEEVNRVGWVQLQNQFDNWRKSRWNTPGDPHRTIECRECHMPLVDSRDPGRGDAMDYNRSPGDGKHRSHRFLGANQFMPLALDLPGAEEQARLTERWLRGEFEVPEIADKWKSGPAVPVEIVAPESVRAGEEVRIQAVVTNHKVGHDFPTGPIDIIQAWLEVTVTDEAGRVLFESGRRDERNFLQEGSFVFKAEPVDQYGNLIDRHNLWEMVGVRYRRAVFPGFSDRAEFTFQCPAFVRTGPAASDADAAVGRTGEALELSSSEEPEARGFSFSAPRTGGELQVRVRLLYRKFGQFLLNYLFGEEAGVSVPVTMMSEDTATIRILPPAEDGALAP